AGDGLTGGGGSALAVNTDGVTLTTSGDAVQAKTPYGANANQHGLSTGGTASANTTVIQGLLDAAGTAGGGTVFVAAGRYAITSLTMKDNVRLVGEGGLDRSGGLDVLKAATSLTSSTNGTVIDMTSSDCAGLEHIQIYGDTSKGSQDL